MATQFLGCRDKQVLALVGRQTIRDYLDCLYLHEKHLHIGALAWAGAGKDPGLTPDLIIDWAARGNRFRPEDLGEVRLSKPIDLKAAKNVWLEALFESRALIEKLPMGELGCLYLNAAGQPVCPDPAAPDFPKLTRHYGSVKGAWPRIVGS